MQRRNVLADRQNQDSATRKLQITNLLNQCRRKVLPTIPDKRNRYGIQGCDNSPEYIFKSEAELQREKQIMRNYRSTLIQDMPSLQPSRNKRQEPSPTQLRNIFQRFLPATEHTPINTERSINQQKQHRKRKHKHFSTVTQHEPAYYKAMSQNFRPVQQAWLTQNTRQTKNKWEFFNSSELRFKQTGKVEKKQQKKSVGAYLQLMQKEKAKGRFQST